MALISMLINFEVIRILFDLDFVEVKIKRIMKILIRSFGPKLDTFNSYRC